MERALTVGPDAGRSASCTALGPNFRHTIRASPSSATWSPGVAGTTRLDSPAGAVVGAAEGADLLVVGRHEHHPALGPRLGPVAQAAVPHARCPVAVVPHD